jgi:hypothetical protein
MMKFMVSLDISSASLALSELSRQLGRDASGDSHSKGDQQSRLRFSTTIWRTNSNAPEPADLEEHLASLLSHFPPDELSKVLPEECDVCINIGVVHDTYTVGFSLSQRAIEMANAYGARIEVACYPTDFNNE